MKTARNLLHGVDLERRGIFRDDLAQRGDIGRCGVVCRLPSRMRSDRGAHVEDLVHSLESDGRNVIAAAR